MATGNYLFHTNLNMQCPICPKLHMFDKCAGLNTSTCQYPVIVIAPPAGSRKFGTYKWLWHIPPIFITLNAYCSPFAVFLKPPLAVSPGARSRSSLLAALILYYIFKKKKVSNRTNRKQKRNKTKSLGRTNFQTSVKYNPKSEKVGTVWKTQIKKESRPSDF